MTPENIFVGPLLRYCDQSLVTICIASFVPLKLRFSIKRTDRSDWLGHDEKPFEIKVSNSLYFYFGRAKPGKKDTGFPLETLLSYNIAVLKEELAAPFEKPKEQAPERNRDDITVEDGQMAISGEMPADEEEEPTYPDYCWDYSRFESIVKTDELSYEAFDLPTFFLQNRWNRESKLNLIHGSCRRIHNLDPAEGGGYDALALADQLLSDTASDLSTRPAVACFTGDQIYADDVHADTFEAIRRLAQKIETGFKEVLAEGLDFPEPGNRQEFLRAHAAIKSEQAKNHLITFSEYLAMYGLVWNQRNWDTSYPDLDAFVKTLPKVRRVLANIPSYMIFDDHEVTDDWNIDLRQEELMRKKPLGFQLVGNGLAAYWLCQGYGNHPKAFIETATYYDHARDYANTIANRNVDIQTQKFLWMIFWDEFANNNRWEFATPTYPPIYFLDTRTQRGTRSGTRPKFEEWPGIDPDEKTSPAALKSFASWTKTLTRLRAQIGTQRPDEVLIVLVTATPVLGIELIEWCQRLVGSLDTFKLDDEAWSANAKWFQKFLETFSGTNLVFLSGDVHYSFTSTGRFKIFDSQALNRGSGWENKSIGVKPKNFPAGNYSYKLVQTTSMLQINCSGLMNWSNVVFPLASALPQVLNSMTGFLGELAKKNLIWTEHGVRLIGDTVPADNFFIYPLKRPEPNLPQAIAALLSPVLEIGKELAPPIPVPISALLLKPISMLEQELGFFDNAAMITRHALAVTSFKSLEVTNYFLMQKPEDKRLITWDLKKLKEL